MAYVVRAAKVLSLLTIAALSFGCQTIGHSETYALQYKKDLRSFYDIEHKAPPTDPEAKKRFEASKEALIAERQVYLPRIYQNNLPLELTDTYDTRAHVVPIRAGDALNILINRVHIKDNRERIPGITADVGVVVTVIDGRSEEPKHVLVAYEKDVGKGVDLPVSDLLAYSVESYNDEPVRIEITVLSLYNIRNRIFTQILGTAAGLGAAASPAYAPAISAAAQIGKVLINSKDSAVIAKFTFELYPWKPGFVPVRGNLGVPRVAYGHYVILNAPTAAEIPPRMNLYLNWNFKPFVTKPRDTQAVAANLAKQVSPWPVPGLPSPAEEEATAQAVDMNYIVLSVDNTRVKNAQQIIGRADAANRVLAELGKDELIAPGRVQLVAGRLDDIKSSVILAAANGRFQTLKKNPDSIDQLFVLFKSNASGLNDADKGQLLDIVRSVVPPMTDAYKTQHPNADLSKVTDLEAWYSFVRKDLVYDPHEGRYCIGSCQH
jgi:hypothetical protein